MPDWRSPAAKSTSCSSRLQRDFDVAAFADAVRPSAHPDRQRHGRRAGHRQCPGRPRCQGQRLRSLFTLMFTPLFTLVRTILVTVTAAVVTATLGPTVMLARLFRVPQGPNSIYTRCIRAWARSINRAAGVTRARPRRRASAQRQRRRLHLQPRELVRHLSARRRGAVVQLRRQDGAPAHSAVRLRRRGGGHRLSRPRQPQAGVQVV